MPDQIYARRAGFSDEEIILRLRDGGLTVVYGGLDPRNFLGEPLEIPGDGHPTGIANLARVKLLYSAVGEIDLQTH